MEAVVRIQPVFATVVTAAGPVPVAELWLGGIPRGAVVLLCEPGDLEANASETMNALAGHGYESIAAEATFAIGQSEAVEVELTELTALLDRLAERGWEREQIGVLGYGAGGRTSLLAATAFSLGAAISVNPAGLDEAAEGSATLLELMEPSRPVRTTWLGLFGQDEPSTPPASVFELAQRLWTGSPVHTEVIDYPGVDGTFHRDGHRALAHAAAFDSWQRIIESLDAHVAPRLTPYARAWRDRQPVG